MRIAKLRTLLTRLMDDDNGCPWTSKQTYQSITSHTREEIDELIKAIDLGDTKNIQEEVGDLLLQVLFYSAIAEKRGDFTFDDVAKTLHDKLTYRYDFIETALAKEGGVLMDATPEELDTLWQQAKLAAQKK
ncbi:MAG: hypothetical protein DHS20C10_12570 [marine bacterium B5-7]|nr:MAG: hypothetical protein DHS20C10_12570 [marine bacterium B5-7]